MRRCVELDENDGANLTNGERMHVCVESYENDGANLLRKLHHDGNGERHS